MADTPPSTARKPRKAAAPKAPLVAASGSTSDEPLIDRAKDRFSKAIEDARAVSQDARTKAGEYREKLTETGSDWIDEARNVGDQAKQRATDLANEGKAKTTDALLGLSKIVSQNAATIDEKVGLKYGDYARTAARSIEGAATRLEAKELGELGEDAKEFVRKSPGLAVGIAAVAGFMLARLFKKSED